MLRSGKSLCSSDSLRSKAQPVLSAVESSHAQRPSRKAEDQIRKRNERVVGVVVSRLSLSVGRFVDDSLKKTQSLKPDSRNPQ